MPAPIYCIGSSSVCVCVWLGRPQIYHYVAYSGERRGGRLYIFFIFLVPKGAAHVKRIMETETAAEQAKPRVVQAGQECASWIVACLTKKEEGTRQVFARWEEVPTHRCYYSDPLHAAALCLWT